MEPEVKEETAGRRTHRRSWWGRAKGTQVETQVLVVFIFQITRCSGLWDWLVDTGTETTADGDMTRCVAGLSSLIPQLLFSSPFGPSIRKPYLGIREKRLALCLLPAPPHPSQDHYPPPSAPSGGKIFSKRINCYYLYKQMVSLAAPVSLEKANGMNYKASTHSPCVPVFSLQVDLFWLLVFLGQTHLDNGFSQTLKE